MANPCESVASAATNFRAPGSSFGLEGGTILEIECRMSPQQTIAHYRIVSKLGEGGMGAVYRATDTKLNRDVAIKVLPEAFRRDTSRMRRFEREARVLASLNHPNIAAIYGVEEGAIVMELVDGQSPAGPLPLDTVIDYARQLATGLEAAHQKGVVHRDLKPANIKVTPDGVVKLLDFGLAKAHEGNDSSAASEGASPTMSPTLSLTATVAGTVLGTAAYMSPEQASGKTVDHRADIWAYGIILYELLTGRRPQRGGETVNDTLAAAILMEPDLSGLGPDTPPPLRHLIERCLRRDPRQRLCDIGDARIFLDEPLELSPRRASSLGRWARLGQSAPYCWRCSSQLRSEAGRPLPRPKPHGSRSPLAKARCRRKPRKRFRHRTAGRLWRSPSTGS